MGGERIRTGSFQLVLPGTGKSAGVGLGDGGGDQLHAGADGRSGPPGRVDEPCHHQRQPGRHSVIHPGAVDPPAVQLLHRVIGRQRPAHRLRLHAVLHGLSAVRQILAARADAV